MAFNQAVCFTLKSAFVFLLLCPPVFALDRSCQFKTTGTLTLDFGVIDQSSNTDLTAPVLAATVGYDIVGDCTNVTMTVAPRLGTVLQLTNGTGGVIPYTLSPFTAQAPGNNKYSQLRLQGTITPASFQNAPVGTYMQSSVLLDISP